MHDSSPISTEASLTPCSDFGALEMPLLDIQPKMKAVHQSLPSEPVPTIIAHAELSATKYHKGEKQS